MRLSISLRLFLAVLLATFLVAATGLALMRLNLTRGFANYVTQIELDRLRVLADSLQRQYAQRGDWSFLPPTGPEQAQWLRQELDRLRDAQRPPTDNTPGEADGPEPAAAAAGALRPQPPPPRAGGRAPDNLSLQDRATLLDRDGRYLAGLRQDRGEQGRRNLVLDGRPIGYLALARVTEPGDALEIAFLADQSHNLGIILLASILLSACAAMLLATHFRRPIRRLADGARQLADGRFETRLDIRRSDELGALANSFNHLAAMLEHSETSRRQWVADTSHELRTPLAVLRAQIEALQDGVRSPDPANLAAMHRQMSTLSKLVDDLYELARADVGQLDYRKQRLDPWPLALGLADSFRERLQQAGLTLTAGPSGARAQVFADPDRLRQVIANLLENCLRYTDRGGRVTLSAADTGREWRLVFDDSAPAVPEAALARLGERFFRIEASRNRALGGSGLGLALCRRIAEAHDGRLEFAASPLGGLRVTLTLPLQE